MISKFDDKYFFLSNFYPCPVVVKGESYPSAEHAFQAQKSLKAETRAAISRCKNPSAAKQMGKRIQLRDDWEEIKIDAMTEVIRAKFSHPVLAFQLVATGEEELVEGNNWKDTFWGVCNGVGQNNLGKILMQIREELKQ